MKKNYADREYNIKDGLVADLGCGTGKLTEILSAAGYDMIGIDNSDEMLNIAMENKSPKSNTLYLNQDMREIELYGTVKAIISICDSMNYMTTKEDLLTVFKLANNYLDPKGIFIFDMNTEYKYKNIGDETIAENRDEGSFIWENYYYPEEMINEYDLTLFIKNPSDSYDKFVENHIQRAYSLETIKELIKEAGMDFVASYDAFTKNPVRSDSERIYIIAREKGK